MRIIELNLEFELILPDDYNPENFNKILIHLKELKGKIIHLIELKDILDDIDKLF